MGEFRKVVEKCISRTKTGAKCKRGVFMPGSRHCCSHWPKQKIKVAA